MLQGSETIAADPVFANAAEKVIPDPATYDDWFKNVDDQRRKLAVGARRFAVVQDRVGGTPSWSAFVDPNTGRLLTTEELQQEQPMDRARRMGQVDALIAERRRATREVATFGFQPEPTKPPPVRQPAAPEPTPRVWDGSIDQSRVMRLAGGVAVAAFEVQESVELAESTKQVILVKGLYAPFPDRPSETVFAWRWESGTDVGDWVADRATAMAGGVAFAASNNQLPPIGVKPAKAKVEAEPAKPAKPSKSDPLAKHPLAGKSRDEQIAALDKMAGFRATLEPEQAWQKKLLAQRYKQEAALTADLHAAVADYKRLNPYGEMPLPALYDQLRAKHSGLTVAQFQGAVLRQKQSGALRIQAFSGAPYQIERPEHVIPGAQELGYYVGPTPTAPDPTMTAAMTNPRPEPMKIKLYRAADDEDIVGNASFSTSKDAAKEYLNNPGFGGRKLFRTDVEINPSAFLDLADEADPIAKVMQITGLPHPGAIGVDEWIPRISDRLEKAGIEWVKVNESFPPDTITYIYISGNEPELRRIKAD